MKALSKDSKKFSSFSYGPEYVDLSNEDDCDKIIKLRLSYEHVNIGLTCIEISLKNQQDNIDVLEQAKQLSINYINNYKNQIKDIRSSN